VVVLLLLALLVATALLLLAALPAQCVSASQGKQHAAGMKQ
jgi:hypothetical protein